jgi:hypothetical protein
MLLETASLIGSALPTIGLASFVLLFGIRAEAPADESNRINKFRLFWFALTRPELFVGAVDWITETNYKKRLVRLRLLLNALCRPHLFVEKFDWLRHDELDNITK